MSIPGKLLEAQRKSERGGGDRRGGMEVTGEEIDFFGQSQLGQDGLDVNVCHFGNMLPWCCCLGDK